MKTDSKKKKKSENLQTPPKYEHKPLSVLMPKLEKTLCHVFVFSPDCMF